MRRGRRNNFRDRLVHDLAAAKTTSYGVEALCFVAFLRADGARIHSDFICE
jgi:hypothetical protein